MLPLGCPPPTPLPSFPAPSISGSQPLTLLPVASESSAPGQEDYQWWGADQSPQTPFLCLGQPIPSPHFTWHPRPPEGEATGGLILATGEEPRVQMWEAHAGGGGSSTGEGTLKQAETRPEREEAAEHRARAACGGRGGGGANHEAGEVQRRMLGPGKPFRRETRVGTPILLKLWRESQQLPEGLKGTKDGVLLRAWPAQLPRGRSQFLPNRKDGDFSK